MYYYDPGRHDGSTLYNRWPVGGYALLKTALLPFGGNLSAQIYAGRLLMLLFFAGTVAMAYLSLCRLLSNRWVALAATLLGFSSFYSLHYNDMISTEVVMSPFGMLLTFHGMVVFRQEGRFRQLLIKSCIALLLGWLVYALLLPFIVFGLASELLHVRSPLASGRAYLKHLVASLVRSRFLALGTVTFLVGFFLLAFNFTNEYIALKGEVPLTELPTFNSLQTRVGASPEFNTTYAAKLAWGTFLKEQFYRLGGLTLPYWLSNHFGDLDKNPEKPAGPAGTLVVVIGIAVSVVCLARALFGHSRVLLAAFLLSGFVWALVFRHAVALHDFSILYCIGVPLVFFSLVLLYTRKLFGGGLDVSLAVAALLVFVISSVQVSRIGDDSEAAAFDKAVVADFENIRGATRPGSRIFVPVPDMPEHLVPFAGARHAMKFYLTGRFIRFDNVRIIDTSNYDFVLTSIPLESGRVLTSRNRLRFLYRPGDYSAAFSKMINRLGEAEPMIRSDFNVYLEDNTLIYLKEECGLEDVKAKFLLHLTPADVDDLPSQSRKYGFDNLDFSFYTHGVRFGGTCLAHVSLPDYDIARIRVGQWIPGEAELWRAEFPFP